MAIDLATITRVTLRQCFLPWYREQMQIYGIPLPPDWNPSDEELGRLADRVAEAFRPVAEEEG